jgi:hypothetical protein
MKTLDDCIQLIQNGQIREGLETLATLMKTENTDLKNTVIQILARYNRLHREKLRGTRTEGEAAIEMNQITYSAIDLIDLLRSEAGFRTPDPQRTYEGEKTRILFVAASPDEEAHLHLDIEMREIEHALETSTHRDRFDLKKITATRPDDLLATMLKFKPHFFHFSGHGDKAGIYLVDDDNTAQPVTSANLGALFRFFKEVIGCVFLNACYASTQAEQILQYVPYVIGSTKALEDTLAIEFAVKFYQAVGEGNDIPYAFEWAKMGVGFKGIEGGGELVMLGEMVK